MKKRIPKMILPLFIAVGCEHNLVLKAQSVKKDQGCRLLPTNRTAMVGAG